MSSTAQHIASVFGEDASLYDVLGVPKTATQSMIKKAYFRVALKCHPDKCPGDEAAHGRFQALSMAHSVLADPQQRELYDVTGEIAGDGEAVGSESFDGWYDYWRNLFPKVTTEGIESFKGKYQGSEEELEDVLKAYNVSKGKMDKVIDTVMLATEADLERFRLMIEEAIAKGEAQEYQAFRKRGGKGKGGRATAKRKAKMEKEAAEAEALAEMLRARHRERQSGNSLAAHRASQFNDMISSLETRYTDPKAKAQGGGKNKKAKGTPQHEDMDDEEFERIQRRMMEKRGKR